MSRHVCKGITPICFLYRYSTASSAQYLLFYLLSNNFNLNLKIITPRVTIPMPILCY